MPGSVPSPLGWAGLLPTLFGRGRWGQAGSLAWVTLAKDAAMLLDDILFSWAGLGRRRKLGAQGQPWHSLHAILSPGREADPNCVIQNRSQSCSACCGGESIHSLPQAKQLPALETQTHSRKK